MTRSEEPTDYLLIRAQSSSDFDPAQFAIVYLSEHYRQILRKRLMDATGLKDDVQLASINYWDDYAVFYTNSRKIGSFLLLVDEDWAFVNVADGDLKSLRKPHNIMLDGQLIVSKTGFAQYHANTKHDHETYWTEYFSIKEALTL
ncbi:hypothetical protein [Pedobacter deserti]|uniref:hypothetical protein n=1 Tax=Pedobacter deserti TaxID=2817382 RepID=UPI00210E36D8|nr:hypothetical protein [Pedobacter sp. SYSU D00382]